MDKREEDNHDRIRYAGDPISALDFNATTVIPSLGFRMNHSAHSYSGLSIPDKENLPNSSVCL